MTYEDTLKMIRQQNPKMPYKEAQQKAKDMYAKFKKAKDELAQEKVPGKITPKKVADKEGGKVDDKAEEKKPEPAEIINSVVSADQEMILGGINVDLLYETEKRIRDIGINRNSIIFHAQKTIPDGKLVIHGKDGVNKLVTFQNDKGDCIPINGYFKIFLP